MNRRRRRPAILTNVVAPYRKPLYEALAREMDVAIFTGGVEGNRASWGDLASQVRGAVVKKSWGFTWTIERRGAGQTPDRRYLHANPGVLADLVRFSPDVVVTNEMGPRTMMALLYGLCAGVPVFVWWGGTLHTERRISPARQALRRLIVRWVRHWFSYGKTSTEYLRLLKVPADRIVELQNCVDDRLYRTPVAPAYSPTPRPVLLHVGQLNRRKGVAELLEAAARLQAKGAIFSLLLVGGGPDEKSLKADVERLGLRNVTFEPSQSPERMPAVYRSADCLVFPTLEDVWGLVANEALLSGCRVIASIYAGCAPELIPPANRFDPLNADDFDRVLGRAVRGELAPANDSVVRPCMQVADQLLRGIAAARGE